MVRVHVSPASSERNRPPSSASIIAQTRSGFAGDTATDVFPIIFGSPFDRRVQVSPASAVFQIPEPGPPERTRHGSRWWSHIAAYSTRGLVTSMLNSLGPVSESTKNIFFHDFPPSVVL